MSGEFSTGSGAEVVRHPIELGSVRMDRLLSVARALLAATVPAGPGTRLAQQQKADQETRSQESTFSFLKTRSVLYLFRSPDQVAGGS
jgi:hypothetical protein